MTKLRLAFLFFSTVFFAQNDCDQVYSGCKKPCGPVSERENRVILNDSLNSVSPYNYIIHQDFKRYSGTFSSTSSFIAPNVLLTAHHNVVRSFLIRGITFHNPKNHEETIYFKKKEFKIYTFKNKLNTLTDIAIIVFEDAKKIAPFYNGHFAVNDVANIKDNNLDAHLTGFPCDIANTKIDKKTKVSSLYTNENLSLIGYNMFTCTGDSGAPLWVIENNVPTIIGIHHGGNEGYMEGCFNISARINKSVLQWIKQITN